MSGASFRPRSKYELPSHEDGAENIPTENQKVYLRHPGYENDANILLVLPALDHREGGIHHETARIACAIFANNAWEGFFTETRTGGRIQVERDGILTQRSYYFHISDDPDEKYPIVPSFSNWRFPHDNLPTSWMSCEPHPPSGPLPRQGSLSEVTLARDVSCRITAHIEGTEHAHLVPKSEEDWFKANGMFRYANQQRPETEPLEDGQNAILLRSDIHTIFDQKRFAIVPKSDVLLVHVLAPGYTFQLAKLYHNVPLQPLAGVSIQYLLARYAWTIFAQSVNFIQQGLTRTLCIYSEGQTIIDQFSGEKCRMLFKQTRSKSRSKSPKKRSRGAAEGDVGSNDESDVEPEPDRGRKRWRDDGWNTSQSTCIDDGLDSELDGKGPYSLTVQSSCAHFIQSAL